MTAAAAAKASYAELARLFIRLSLTAFGGPPAHLAMAEDEIVRRRGWLTRQQFLDLIAATNLIPGPNSTETMIHVGYTQRGVPGAILAGACFIIPAALISLALAILYASTGMIPAVSTLFWGLQPAIVAVIAVAAWRLTPSALKNRLLIVLFVAALLILALDALPEAVVIIGGGLLYALLLLRVTSAAALLIPFAQIAVEVAERAAVSALDVFWYFLRIGSVLFGSGYVLFAYIQQDVVNTFGWLTQRQLLNAIAIGQFTPGPVLTTSTVVGYLVADLPGAIAATVGIFLPSFVLVLITAPYIPRMRQSRFLSAFLDGANAAVVAAIAATLLDLGRAALLPLPNAPDNLAGISLLAILLIGVSLLALVRFRINATWVLIACGAVGVAYGAWLG
jgi:chromate transporter